MTSIKIKTLNILSILLAIIFLMSGCAEKNNLQSNNNSNTNAIEKDEQTKQLGYVSIYKNAAIFLRWTNLNNQLEGQLQIASLVNDKVESQTHSFTGIMNASNISIKFSGSLWTDSLSGMTWTGTLVGDTLTLVFPAKDGTLQTITFKSGSINDYNQAISNLQGQSAAKTAVEAYQGKQEEVRKALNIALHNLNEDTSSLSSLKFDSDIENINESLATMQEHFNKLKQDASLTPLSNYQLNTVVKYDLETSMKYDLDTNMAYKINTALGYDIKQAQQLSAKVNDEISILQNCWGEYLKYNSPSSQFNQDIISSAIAAAKEQQPLLEKKISSAQEQGNYYYNQGKQLYQTAKDFVSGLSVTGSN